MDGQVKFAIRTYFDGYYDEDIADIPPIIQGLSTRDLGIHKIKVKSSSNKVNITITLERPGLIIGKKGSTIDALKEHLENVLSKKVVIHIEDFDPWSSL